MSLIFEINKLLVSLNEISTENEKSRIEFLKTRYESRKSAYEITDFNTILKFSEKLDLIKIEDENVFLNKNGMDLLESILLNKSKSSPNIIYSNLIEISFLKKIFFKSNKIIDEFLKIINLFWIDESQQKPFLIYILKKEDEFDKILIKFLQEIRIFELNNKKIVCVDGLVEISKIKNNVNTISEEEFEQHLEKNIKIGKLGEEFTIKEEEKRLKEENRIDLSFDIKQVSLTDVYAGFDLKSYENSKSFLTKHDRMIEVKATTSSRPRFYWSTNEVNKAKELGEKYWIYLWVNIESEKRKLIKIPNPYKEFFITNTKKPECAGYFFDEELIAESSTNYGKWCNGIY